MGGKLSVRILEEGMIIESPLWEEEKDFEGRKVLDIL